VSPRTIPGINSGSYLIPVRVQLESGNLKINTAAVEAPKKEVRRRVDRYLAGEPEGFELEVSLPDGFKGDVLSEVLEICYGRTITYGELAERVGTAPVAVGQALGSNCVPLIMPCHRVVSAEGPGGYRFGIEVKEELLELEKGVK
jgi:methylated-DNA-[protein]-cysteine S-methyltransferase